MKIESAYWMESFWIRVVDSRKRVSLGGILWKTTLAMEDLPLLRCVNVCVW